MQQASTDKVAAAAAVAVQAVGSEGHSVIISKAMATLNDNCGTLCVCASAWPAGPSISVRNIEKTQRIPSLCSVIHELLHMLINMKNIYESKYKNI